jgi:HEAT repeat protein
MLSARPLVRALAVAALVAALGLTACVSVESEPIARPGSDIVLKLEIERRVAEIPYMHGVELVANLERLADIGEPAVPYLLDALKSDDRLSRASACWTLGVMGDRRNIEAVRDMLDDRDHVVRYQAAASLVELGDGTGFPVLVNGLAAPDIQTRYKCFEALRDATGQDFGYEHDAAPSLRREAVARWQNWLEGWRASAL